MINCSIEMKNYQSFPQQFMCTELSRIRDFQNNLKIMKNNFEKTWPTAIPLFLLQSFHWLLFYSDISLS